MRTYLNISCFLVCLTAASSALAADTTDTTPSDLSDEQSKLVRQLLDDVCGDSWCEGAYEWKFPKVVCDFAGGTCTLTFLATDRGPTPAANYWRSCKVQDLTAFSDLVQTAPNGYSSLTDPFYDKVSACIDHIEHNLPNE
ncbi:MAG TPA: hypothetical protein VNO21_10330 [Polyangiaceae bacterium]|nr:hypothetical protein [Polyangiaceae bacterium]